MSDSPQEAKVWEWLTISNHLKFDLVPDLIFFSKPRQNRKPL